MSLTELQALEETLNFFDLVIYTPLAIGIVIYFIWRNRKGKKAPDEDMDDL